MDSIVVIAARGREVPESLTLEEIRAVCAALAPPVVDEPVDPIGFRIT